MRIEEIWSEWQTVKEIGHGSYGTVYKCVRTSENIEEFSAIKVISIPSDENQDIALNKEKMTGSQKREYYAEIKDGLVNEIKLLISLKGAPNIVTIEDYKVVEKTDRVGWEIFIRMELLTDLNTYFSDKDITEEEVVKLGTDICAALSLCEKRKIVHRDIKPENIFVSEFGVFKLGDFGVAKQFDGTASSMSVKGTFNYMAPEVANNHHGDIRADIYSLGIVMYQLLNNNRLPLIDPEKTFVKHSERVQALEKRMDGAEIPKLRNVNTQLDNAILQALAFDVNKRYRSASDFSNELKKVKPGTEPIQPVTESNPPVPAPVPTPKKTGFFKKHSGLVIIVCVALIASIAAGLCIGTILKNRGNKGNDNPPGVDGGTTGTSELEGDIDIEYSGIINNGIYTYNNVDYCAGVSDGQVKSGFYAVSSNERRLLTDKTVTSDFTIINSEIYFTVIDEHKTEKKSSDSPDKENVVNCSCWKMSMNGTNEQKLFDYDGSGFVVWADEKTVYYMDTKYDIRYGYSLKKIELKNEDGSAVENPEPEEIISGYKTNAAGGVSEFGCDRKNVFCNQKYIFCGVGNNDDIYSYRGESSDKNDVFKYEIGTAGTAKQKIAEIKAEKIFFDGSNCIYAKAQSGSALMKYSIEENKGESVPVGDYELEGLSDGRPVLSDSEGRLYYNEGKDLIPVENAAVIKACFDGESLKIDNGNYLIFEDKSLKLNEKSFTQCRLSSISNGEKTVLKFYDDRDSNDIFAIGKNIHLYGRSRYKNAVYRIKWDDNPEIGKTCTDKVSIPDFKSQKLSDNIKSYLEFLGFKIEPQNEEVFDETVEAGNIVSQSLTGEAKFGSTIKFSVSKGIDPRNKDYIDATDADWKNFEKAFSGMAVPEIYTRESTFAENLFFNCLCTEGSIGVYKHYFTDLVLVNADETPDPEGRYVTDVTENPEIIESEKYYVFSKEHLDWVFEKVFGIKKEEIPELSGYDIYLGPDGNYYMLYPEGIDEVHTVKVKSFTQEPTGEYTVICDCSGTQQTFTVALMNKPDGGKYWSLFAIQ